MTVDPDGHSYAKTLNHRKTIWKTQKQQPTENQTNTKTEISLKVAVRFSHLDCQGGLFAPLPAVSYVTGYDILFLHAVNCPYSTATRYEMAA